MIRGTIPFICDECKKIFMGLDVELGATAYTMPVACPRCGSKHTMPFSPLSLFSRRQYKKIWEHMDKGE